PVQKGDPASVLTAPDKALAQASAVATQDSSARHGVLPMPPVARPGDRLEDIDTPALVLELDAFEDNLRSMQALAESHGLALRPHGKAHKCPQVALRQVALGARGICCQKVSETLPFIQAGITDILISNEVVGRSKLELLARLAAQARLTVC